jgi:hypothetical protein
MFAIIDWLLNLWHLISYWFGEIFRETIKFFTTSWGVILIMGGMVWFVFNDTIEALNGVAALVSGRTIDAYNQSAPGTISQILTVCNTFTPLDEFCQYFGAYMTLVIAWGTYKLIKSWIPTLSGSG